MSKVAFIKNSDLKGCLSLLQVWAWERLHLKPRLCVNLQLDGQIPLGCRWNVQKYFDETPARQLDFYRNELNRMKIFQMEWEPYTPFLDHLPPICTEYPVIWRARVPLICFEIVEMHVPNRVLRQFGLAQHVPQFVKKIERKAKKGGHQKDWAAEHQNYIHRWNDRHFCIVEQIESTPQESDYYTWYWRITRRWILHATTSPVELQRGYVPRGIDERELVSAIDDVQTITNRGLELARAGTYPEAQKHASIYQSIMQRLHQALHRTHEDLHDGREVAQLVYTRQQRHRRGRRRNDNEAGPSQRADDGAGSSQPQTQPDHELIEGRDGGSRRQRRRRRVLG
ncbi:serine/threonine-protein phosphatase 7 long form homolog [Asparagus officinalis]|uniref:serine/threonine-protein phosphatase 7 long form homolog n=1 Tax=Asparagus officinalis TaxID=4686 RepID=UPI00098E11D1|nr:serine/threonine-protein phosphatase 7 long form homolog [Asparagus officinalis]